MPSTVIKSFHYDAEKQLLKVVFISGHEYEYQMVSEETYRAMKASSSKGEYLNRYIKGHHDFKKIK